MAVRDVTAKPQIGATRPAPKRTRRRWGRWVVVGAVTLSAAGIGGWMWHRHRAAVALAARPKGRVVTVALGDVERTVVSSGKVVSNLDIDIKCRASGEVVKLPFDISQSVKKGDLLCQLDPTDEQLAVRSGEASVAQTNAKLAQAKTSLARAELNLATTRLRNEATLASAKVKSTNAKAKAERQRQLLAQELGSQEELETAQTDAAVATADERAAEIAIEELKQQAIQLDHTRQDVSAADAELQSQQIALDTQKQQLGYTTVVAPMDGTVSDLKVQIGTIVASGTNAVNGGTTIMTLSDLSRVFVIATVDESDIGGVRVDQPARIGVDSYPGRTFAGKVVRVAVKGVSAQNVVTFEVKVEVTDGFKTLLKPEMTGNVTIVQDERRKVLVVPTSAVTRRADKVAVTLAGGEQRDVTLGVQGVENVEVTNGLSAGEQIRVNDQEPPSRWRNDGERGGGPGGGPPPQ